MRTLTSQVKWVCYCIIAMRLIWLPRDNHAQDSILASKYSLSSRCWCHQIWTWIIVNLLQRVILVCLDAALDQAAVPRQQSWGQAHEIHGLDEVSDRSRFPRAQSKFQTCPIWHGWAFKTSQHVESVTLFSIHSDHILDAHLYSRHSFVVLWN